MNVLDQDIKQALRLHQSGKLADAESIYRRILSSAPQHPDALHLLGMIAMQVGQPVPAEALIRNAISVRPEFPDALNNLGRLLTDQNKFAEAAETYHKLLELRPDDAKAWYILATNLRSISRYQEALEAVHRAAELNPKFGEAFLEMGDLHRQMKNPVQALESARRAIALLPEVSNGFNSLGNGLTDLQQFAEAIDAYRRAIKLEPANSKYHFNLGTVLWRSGKAEDSLVEFATALELDPADAMAHSVKGTALASLRRYSEAIVCHTRAVQLSPESAILHHAMGECYRLAGENTLAGSSFQRAVEIDSKLASAWLKLGEVHVMMGNFDLAARELAIALELEPKNTIAYRHLASLGKLKSEAEITHLRGLLESGGLSVKEQVSVGFALGNLLDERDEFDEAFSRYDHANRLFLQHVIADDARFDSLKLIASVNAKVDLLTSEFFHTRREWGSGSQVPVFIVGMPRSGTTLVEQIAASHPDVFGAGERSEIRLFSNQLGDAGQWTLDKIRHLASDYMDRLTTLSPAATRITDKMPGNIMHLGLIAALFPHARIIVCKRGPIDNCLSCFFQQFAKNNLVFSYDLLDCSTQLLEQERLIEHWKKVLPNPMMLMQYEDMVADQETQSRRLIEFLGLPWHPACLEFYNTKRAVLTASVWQVRQPIYTGSVGRWRHYEKFLGPLIKALNL